jgi:uncharacterized protein (DUF1800 family)
MPADQSGLTGNQVDTVAARQSTLIDSSSEFANKHLPTVQRTSAGLEPYTGPWGISQVSHLLRRAMFGAAKSDIEVLQQHSLADAVDLLLAVPPPEPSAPLAYDTRELVSIGDTWVYQPYKSPDATVTFVPTGIRTTSLKCWWLGLMLDQPLSIREKMVLFWHNHFVTAVGTVGDPRFSYRYLTLLRTNALGNFRTLVKQVTVDGAILRYLNGNTNTKSSPNENYGRELQELFTIGKGPEIASGDYTNYTENDVKAAARVLTGWRDDAAPLTSPSTDAWRFDATRHDTADKQFSERYGNTVITGRSGADGALELDDLVAMILAQPETARALCRQLYRWFVYYLIDAQTEASVIEPMAAILRSNNYEVLPALRALLTSAHFYDAVNMGCVIKSPLDFVVGLCRQLSMKIPSADVPQRYTFLAYLLSQASSMQQNLGDPPNVAGWAAYYQLPQYYELWISSDTLPRRNAMTGTMARAGYSNGGATLAIDSLAFVRSLTNPGDAVSLIDDAAQRLYAIPLTQNQKAFLKDTLVPGLPDYEWTAEWNSYVADPTNVQKSAPVKTKLEALLSTMLRMPEYQLS